MAEYEAAVEANSSYFRAHYQLAKSYLAESNYKSGLDQLQQTIQLEPGFEPAYADWRLVIDTWKKLPDRQKTYKPRARTLAADYKIWGDTFAQAGNPDEASDRYCKAANLDSRYKNLCPDHHL